MKGHRSGTICYAARMLSLGYGLLIALFMLGVAVMLFVQNANNGRAIEAIAWLASWTAFLIPLALAIIAWRWHFVGGLLSMATWLIVCTALLAAGDMQWGVHALLAPFMIGGLLHLAAWRQEKKADQLQQA